MTTTQQIKNQTSQGVSYLIFAVLNNSEWKDKCVRVMKAVHRGKITGEKIIVNVQVLIRESCFDLLIEGVDRRVGDGGAVIADRIYRHQMEIGVRDKKRRAVYNRKCKRQLL